MTKIKWLPFFFLLLLAEDLAAVFVTLLGVLISSCSSSDSCPFFLFLAKTKDI